MLKLFNRIVSSITRNNLVLVRHKQYFDGKRCCAIGAIAVTLSSVEICKGADTPTLCKNIVKSGLGWTDNDLFWLENGFEGAFPMLSIPEKYKDRYELGQRLALLAQAV